MQRQLDTKSYAAALAFLVGSAVLLARPLDVAAQAPPPPGVGVTVGPVDIGLHGYLRAPLRLAWKSRNPDNLPGGEEGTNLRTPWLVDDDYFRSGFAYTRLQESDWAELYLTATSKYLVGEVALMGSLFSDWARPILDRQWGISQGSLMFRWQAEGPRLKFRMHVKGGAFWDRFGWLENYDTYVFGRTHQLGGQVRFEFAGEKFALHLIHGVGAHLEAIEANQGLTLLNYINLGVRYGDLFQSGFYFLGSNMADKRQLKELVDADMNVVGVDAQIITPYTGRIYLAGSIVTANHATYMAPAIEVMHAFGGRGLTENYLGSEKSENGTGTLYNLALETQYSLRALLSRVRPGNVPTLGFFGNGDLTLRLFGLVTYVKSKQVDFDPRINRDGVLYFKWGAEMLWQGLPWVFVALRYDRVIMDVQDEASSFRVLSPKIGVISKWLLGAQIFLQYSRYLYGDRVLLRPGQVLQETRPDADVFKLQAQISF